MKNSKSHLRIAKTNANSFKRKFAFRKLFLQITAILVVGFVFTASAISTGHVKGSGAFAATTASVVMLTGKIEGKETATHKADGTEKTAEEKMQYVVKFQIDEAVANFKGDPETLKELKDLKDKVAAFKVSEEDATIKDIRKQLDDASARLKALTETPATEKGHRTIKEALEAAFASKKSEIEAAIKGHQNAPIHLTMKASTMSVTNTIGSGSTFNTITENTGIISPTRRRELTYEAYVSVGSINANRAVWIEQTTSTGTPVMLAEGAAKTQLDSVWVEQTTSVKKIAVYGKVTTELMADVPQLISYIENDLMRRMDIVLENQLFSGNGTGDNLKGAITYATAFSAGSLANTVANANELDVMEAVAVQVKRAYGLANAIYIHPDTMAKIKLIKNSLGSPVWKDYVTTNGMMNVSGMNIVETTAITAGSYLGGDMKVVHKLNREELGIQIGLDGNDFTNNVKTLLLEKRVAQFVSANDTGLLVTGTFADGIAALLAV